jgi:ABC-2 type transport system permease protein
VVVVPLFVLLVSSALQVLFAFVWSIRFNDTLLGDALMAWHGATWLKLQAAFLMFVAAATAWYLPLVAYLMLVSVWARRNAFLWAVLPPVSILAIEGLILRSNEFGAFLGRRLSGVFEITGEAFSGAQNPSMVSMGEAVSSIAAVFTSYETWLGVLAGAAMTFATIRIRRLRDDS